MRLEEIEKCHCGMLLSDCTYPDCFTVHNHSATGHPALSTSRHHRIERHFRQGVLDFWVERATDDALGALIDMLATNLSYKAKLKQHLINLYWGKISPKMPKNTALYPRKRT